MLYDLIVIGGGTAGLSAALYAVRGGLHTLVLEAMVHGGQIVTSPEVENYPALPNVSGAEYAQILLEQVEKMSIVGESDSDTAPKFELKYEGVEGVSLEGGVKEVRTPSAVYRARSIIWAAGVSPRKLGVPGEERFQGCGVSFCATCDGALYKDKEVAVIGGGNTALEEALFLAKLCSKVHLIHRRADFRGEAALSARLRREENIILHMPADVLAFEGQRRLESVLLKTASGEETLPVAAVFLAVGKIPANNLLSSCIDLDEEGYIRAGEDCRTNVAGVFVAGDCRQKPLRQLVTAAADGAVAATQAIAYVGMNK